MNNKINTEKKKNILPFKQPAAFYYKKAKQANNNNRVLDALVFYRKASELEPDNFDYISGMADIYTELEFKRDVLCIDSISVDNGDYIDVGNPVANGAVVPVVIKTLVFE